MIRPVFNEGDDVLSYVARIQEWERVQYNDAMQECREIDRICKQNVGGNNLPSARRAPRNTKNREFLVEVRQSNRYEGVVSMNTRAQRISIHELAENNPVLRNIIRNKM